MADFDLKTTGFHSNITQLVYFKNCSVCNVYPVTLKTRIYFNVHLSLQVIVHLNQYDFREAKTLWLDLMPEATPKD